jgi:hypothetical protein
MDDRLLFAWISPVQSASFCGREFKYRSAHNRVARSFLYAQRLQSGRSKWMKETLKKLKCETKKERWIIAYGFLVAYVLTKRTACTVLTRYNNFALRLRFAPKGATKRKSRHVLPAASPGLKLAVCNCTATPSTVNMENQFAFRSPCGVISLSAACIVAALCIRNAILSLVS